MYTVLESALDRTKQLAGIDTLDFSRDDYATELLALSAGITEDVILADVTHYRPFYVAAKLLEQDLDVQALSEADRVKFTGQAKPIASLLALQAAYDARYYLTIPVGFEALPVSADKPVMSIFTS